MKIFIYLIAILSVLNSYGQGYWQQHADYVMDITMDAEKHQFAGKQKLTYTNNSPDTLDKVFYHLYFNAFQPNSMMDVRSRTIADPDRRVGDRIFQLSDDEIGYQKITSLKQDGKDLTYEVSGTILEVMLNEPILPGSKVVFDMEFNGQVPLQIRRSGRDNAEGVEFSMTQWYPKLCEYDEDGWHSNPYIGREFHGVWGNFDVTIHMDKDYLIGGTGVLQNPEEVGFGYEQEGQKVKQPRGKMLKWHFKAENVHDFAWAADPDYLHKVVKGPDGLTIHLIHQDDEDYNDKWENLAEYVDDIFRIMNDNFGQYPYEAYTVIQGGDGGMEYPMATLITGNRSEASLIGVTVHEAIHSWYQGVLATNESKYPWMDEGFTSFASSFVTNELYRSESANPYIGSYRSYYSIAGTPYHEPMTTHADHYNTNRMYGISAYSMGSMVLSQLLYIMGEEAFFNGMKQYYYTWKFRHPRPDDFKRIMEKASDLELDWFFENWIGTTKRIDYGISEVSSEGERTKVKLANLGSMPMPLEITITKNDGSTMLYYIPLRIMRGEKDFGDSEAVTVLPDWPWTYPFYEFEIPFAAEELKEMVIDQNDYVADIDKDNNSYPFGSENTFKK